MYYCVALLIQEARGVHNRVSSTCVGLCVHMLICKNLLWYTRQEQKLKAAWSVDAAARVVELETELKKVKKALAKAERDFEHEHARRLSLEGDVQLWRDKFRVARGLRPSASYWLQS